MKERSTAERVLFNISRLFSFFFVISLVVTITMFLFLRGMELDELLVRRNARQTFWCLVAMTFLGSGLDALRRQRTVDQPLKRITGALDRISRGDFSVRLNTKDRDLYQSGFREICDGINHLAGELGGVETLRTDFIASVSHELKTPLAAVNNYAHLLCTPGLSGEKQAEYARAISTITHRLADLVANILRLNKLENQQIFPQTKVFDLGEQLAQCILEQESAWEAKDLTLDCQLCEQVRIEADPELLALVWTNLLSNAIKFTPPKGTIAVRLTTDGGWASVAFSDTGCGMTPETGARIFEKFYQGDTAHATQGNGLGLALVKRVVDITGGVISVSSTPGKGSTFTVRLGRCVDENG